MSLSLPASLYTLLNPQLYSVFPLQWAQAVLFKEKKWLQGLLIFFYLVSLVTSQNQITSNQHWDNQHQKPFFRLLWALQESLNKSTAQLFLLYTLTKGSSISSSADMSGDLSSSVSHPPPLLTLPQIWAKAWELKQLQSLFLSLPLSHGSTDLNSAVKTVIYTLWNAPGLCLFQASLAVLQGIFARFTRL